MNSIAPTITISPRRLAPIDGTIQALVRIHTPTEDTTPQRPLNLSLVLDTSGSMSGAPIQAVRQACLSILPTLHGHRLNITRYSDDATSLYGGVVDTANIDSLNHILRQIDNTHGCTNLYEGWATGAKDIAPHATPSMLSHIIILSDGQVNRGVTDPHAIRTSIDTLYQQGNISTTTLGIGRHFNHTLMQAITCGGVAHYAEGIKELELYLADEVARLQAIHTNHPKIRIHAVDADTGQHIQGMQIRSLHQEDTDTPADHPWSITPIPLHAEGWKGITIEGIPAGTSNLRITVDLRYTDRDGIAQHIEYPYTLHLNNDTTEDAAVVERINELEAAEIQRRIAEDVANHRIQEGKDRITALYAMGQTNQYIRGMADKMNHIIEHNDAGLVAKEAVYSAYAMSSRTATVNEVANDAAGDAFRRIVMGRKTP